MTSIDYETIKNCDRILNLYSEKKEIRNLKYVLETMVHLCEKYGVNELPINDNLLFNLLLVFNDLIYEDKIDYVKYRMENFRYSVLPNDISTGTVCKVPSHGFLKRDGWAREFLYMMPNSSITDHMHNDDIEIYSCIDGSMSVNNIQQDVDIVGIGENHNIDEVKTLSIIETYKIAKEKLNEENIQYMNENVRNTFVKSLNR